VPANTLLIDNMPFLVGLSEVLKVRGLIDATAGVGHIIFLEQKLIMLGVTEAGDKSDPVPLLKPFVTAAKKLCQRTGRVLRIRAA